MPAINPKAAQGVIRRVYQRKPTPSRPINVTPLAGFAFGVQGRLPFWEGFEASIKTALSKLPLVKPLRRVNEHYVQHMRMHLLYVCMHIYIYI